MNSYLENKSKWSMYLDSHSVNGIYLWIVIYLQYNRIITAYYHLKKKKQKAETKVMDWNSP